MNRKEWDVEWDTFLEDTNVLNILDYLSHLPYNILAWKFTIFAKPYV